jgi:hypothetical protein
MYLGHLTTIGAAKHRLWRLTEWNVRAHQFNAVYMGARSRILVPLEWAAWCEAEAKRIGGAVGRTAAVVARKDTLAVFVNRVAGNAGDDLAREEDV